MRASLGGLLVALGCLTFAHAAHNVTVDHSETSQLTYLPASKWVEVESRAKDSATVGQYNGTATMASAVGAQVSLTFKGTAIYWLGYGTSNSTQFVEVTMDDVVVMVDVSPAALAATRESAAFFRPNLRANQSHNITVRIIKTDSSSALYHVAFIYTVPGEGGTHSAMEANTILEVPHTAVTNAVTSASEPIAAPSTSKEDQTSSPNKSNKKAGVIVVGALVGLGALVGGLSLYARRRRSKIDAERSARSYLTLDGGEGRPRIGMLEASIARARYGDVEAPTLPLDGQTQAIPPMEKAALVEGVAVSRQSLRETRRARPPDLTLSESRPQTRTETSSLAITTPHQRAKKRALLESMVLPKTALPPYPGSPHTRY